MAGLIWRLLYISLLGPIQKVRKVRVRGGCVKDEGENRVKGEWVQGKKGVVGISTVKGELVRGEGEKGE